MHHSLLSNPFWRAVRGDKTWTPNLAHFTKQGCYQQGEWLCYHLSGAGTGLAHQSPGTGQRSAVIPCSTAPLTDFTTHPCSKNAWMLQFLLLLSSAWAHTPSTTIPVKHRAHPLPKSKPVDALWQINTVKWGVNVHSSCSEISFTKPRAARNIQLLQGQTKALFTGQVPNSGKLGYTVNTKQQFFSVLSCTYACFRVKETDTDIF